MAKGILSLTCTVQRSSGEFCDAPSEEDVPFPICGQHAAQLYRWVRQSMGDFRNDRTFMLWHTLVEKPKWEQEQEAKKRREKLHRDPLVYYVQIGEHVKIGFTENLKQRLAAYPPNKRLLATETGTRAVEGQRLLKFREYLAMGNEWFHPGAKLIEHINALRVASGASPIRKFT